MKILFLYFSGTGSTAKLADLIAIQFKNLGHDVTFSKLRTFDVMLIDDFDIIGVGCPAYAYRAPRIVTKILKTFPSSQKKFFIFVTSGGEPGNTLWNLYKVLSKKDWIYSGGIQVTGPTNLRSWMPKLNETPLTQSLYISNSNYFRKFCIDIIDNVELNDNQYSEKIFSIRPKPKLKYSIFTTFLSFNITMRSTIGKKHIDHIRCNKCGLCVTKICPSGAIYLEDKTSYPKFKELSCVGCNGCVNLCPQDAIWSLMTRNHHQYNLNKKYIFSDLNNNKSNNE